MQTTTETIAKGLTLEYYPDGVMIYRLTTMQRQSIDAWIDLVQQHEHAATIAQRPLYRVLDLRQAGYPTPYASTRAVWVATNTPENLVESLAVLVADTVALQFVKVVTNRLPSRYRSAVKLFLNEQEALDWLAYRRSELR